MKTLTESGLNRVYQATRKHDYGTITAYRSARDCGEGERYTYRENQQRNHSLFAKLQAAGMHVTKIRGSYIENFKSNKAREVGESSYLVIDLDDRGGLLPLLLKLGEEFDQDSIIFGKAGSAGVLIGTNHCPNGHPGYHKHDIQGGALFGHEGEFMSRVNGRPFIFAIKDVPTNLGESTDVLQAPPRYPTEIRSVKETAKRHWSEIDLPLSQQINEESLSRVWQHMDSARPFSLLTAFRSSHTRDENISRNKKLAAQIRNLGYGFFYLDGRWIENSGTPDEILVSEDTLFVIGPIGGDEQFTNDMIEFGRQYNQDGVIVKNTDGIKIYGKDGKAFHEFSKLNPGAIGQIYSKLRTGKVADTFTFTEDADPRVGWTYAREDISWIGRLAGLKGSE
jgi:hypothetical protein